MCREQARHCGASAGKHANSMLNGGERTSEAQEFEAFLRSSAFIEGTTQRASQHVSGTKTVSSKVKVHLSRGPVNSMCEMAAGCGRRPALGGALLHLCILSLWAGACHEIK